MSVQERRLLILYGSQTGNAKEVAERVEQEAVRLHFVTELTSMDAYPKQKLPQEKLVFFICSTTGQGDPPNNMKKFWRFLLRKDLPANSLTNLHVAVFGLGDSGYPLYNAVARRCSQRLLDLGAQALCERGLGDDQHPKGYDGALDPWLTALWPKVLTHFPLPPNTQPIQGQLPESYEAQIVDQVNVTPFSAFKFGEDTESYHPIPCRLITNQRLTDAKYDQDVRHIEFDIKDSGLSYEPGDVLVVHPQNSEATVSACLEWAKLKPDTLVTIQPTKHCLHPWTQRVTVSAKALFQQHLDMQGTPRRTFFESLSYFATNDKEREKLQEFASAEFQDDLYKYCRREKRTYLEVLQQFSSCKLSLSSLVSIVPRLLPRLFSISSSLLAHPGQAHITVAVVRFRTPWNREATGTCSTYLQQLQPGVEVPLWVVKGTISLPTTSAVLVGPGTGIAPIRAMCEQLDHLKRQKNKAALQCDPVHVFFGNRYRTKDYLYEREWDALLHSNAITSFHTAFSRDQDEKVYVQDILKQQGASVWTTLQSGGTFILVGNAKKMPTDVREAVLEICAQHGKLDTAEAKKFMSKLELERRFLMETWA